MSVRPAASQSKKDSPYTRGDYWLGTKASAENFYVFRYNKEQRRADSWSTGTSELTEAMKALDERWLAANDQSPAFCAYCGQKIADGGTYALLQAISDYKIEHASKKVSYEIIRARLAHVIRFVLEKHHEDMPCNLTTTDQFAQSFREWLLPQPVIWTNGQDEITVQHERTISSVEESVHQLRAVLNFAVKKGRSDAKPVFEAKTRAVVSEPVRERASLDNIAMMVEYAMQPNLRREGLYRFLIAAICTAARPDAIYDMNVNPKRYQWEPDKGLFNLNPHGRVQTKKHRPVVPVLAPLKALLDTASEDGWVVHYQGHRVVNVRSAWRSMVSDLKLGSGRGWGAYVMRRSIAQLLRSPGVDSWDIQGLLGHRTAGTTEIYTRESVFPTAMARLEDIIADIEGRIGVSLSTIAR